MNDEELDDLLQHLRRAVRGVRADLDDRLITTRLADLPGPEHRLAAYLRGLRDELSFGGQDAAARTLRRFSDVRTESGGRVSGIVLDMVGAHQRIYGTPTVDLVGSPELDDLVAELDALIRDLEDGGEHADLPR